jgi:phosphoglycerate dehydrogenase-like enzyme
MHSDLKLIVTSRSFSQNPALRAECLRIFPNTIFNEEGLALKGEALTEFLKPAQAAIVALEKFDSAILAELPKLQVLAKYGVGLDNIDQEALKEFSVRLVWQGGVNRRSVAELVLSFALGISHNVFHSSRQMAQGIWKTAGGFDLAGKTFAVIGCGFIGSEVLRILQPFGCRLLVVDVLDKSDVCCEFGAQQVSFEEALKTADILSLHIPLNSQTRDLVNRSELGKMKRSAILLNTSRGGIVNEAALAEALAAEKIAAAASDVFVSEPVDPEMPLLKLPNFFATPHIGGNSAEAVMAMGFAAVHGLAKAWEEMKR